MCMEGSIDYVMASLPSVLRAQPAVQDCLSYSLTPLFQMLIDRSRYDYC